MTERLHFHFSLSYIGEGNGNPLQCSCLENPRTGEPGGLPSMGLHRVGHDWSDIAAAAALLFLNILIFCCWIVFLPLYQTWRLFIHKLACMCAKSLQSCPNICNPMDCSPPGSSVLGILQARIQEWFAMPSSRVSSQPRYGTWVSYVSCIGKQFLYY